jgi:uncharacterized lipoprotein YbaY
MKNLIVQLSILLSLSLAITSCKDNKNEDPAPAVPTGTVCRQTKVDKSSFQLR